MDRDFEIVRLAGRGSFSTVYEARQRSAGGRPVALKILHRGIQNLVEQNMGRSRNPYLREQLLAQRLKNTNVCRVYKCGTTLEGRYYAALEWAPGEPLDQLLHRYPKGLPIRWAADVIAQVGRTVAAMHEARVVHRDLKPTNIMVLIDDNDVTARVLDLGIAKLAGEQEGITDGILVGTPAYMAPEQARGEAGDARSDVFSFAAIAYEVLTGTRHIVVSDHDRRGSDAYVSYLLSDAPIPSQPATQLRPDLPAAVDPALNRALARDPDTRTPSVDAFLADLVPALHAHELEVDESGRRWGWLRRWFRRG